MLISHSKKFIFVHIYKTAGTSISAFLNKYGFSKYSLRNKIEAKLGIYPAIYSEDFNKHAGVCEIKKELPSQIFNEYLKFCVIRNSWDWQVSLYHYILKDHNNQHHEIVKQLGSFDKYIEWRVNEELILQNEYIRDSKGNILVNEVYSFDRLDMELKSLAYKLKLKVVKEIPVLNKSERKSYRYYYTEKTKTLIQRAYQEDITAFGFKF